MQRENVTDVSCNSHGWLFFRSIGAKRLLPRRTSPWGPIDACHSATYILGQDGPLQHRSSFVACTGISVRTIWHGGMAVVAAKRSLKFIAAASLDRRVSAQRTLLAESGERRGANRSVGSRPCSPLSFQYRQVHAPQGDNTTRDGMGWANGSRACASLHSPTINHPDTRREQGSRRTTSV